MAFVSYQSGRGFADHLATTLGTRKWVVAPRLTKELKARGYELAISRKRFTAIRQEFLQQQAARLIAAAA